MQAMRLVEIASARRLLPRGVRILPVLPGKTLGALYCASYEAPSTLCYHELAIAPALVHAKRRAGFWISHIYVDERASVAGGRRIWGLPKEMARFDWQPARGRLSVYQGTRILCTISWSRYGRRTQVPLWVPVLGIGGLRLQFFHLSGTAQIGPRAAHIGIDPALPFGGLGFGSVRNVVYAERLKLTVQAPRPIH